MNTSTENLPSCSLKGKVAIVTGAARGIGRSTVFGLLAAGARVFAVSRSAEDLSELKKEIKQGELEFASVDLADPSASAEVPDKAIAAFGQLDIVVNNAGVGSGENPRPVAGFDDAFWDYTLAVNLTAPYRLSKAAIPWLMKQGQGRIVNIASLAGKVGLLHGAAYAASKHGLLGLTRTMAIELAPSKITVNAVCPGVVRTRSNQRRLEYDSRRTGAAIETIEKGLNPLGRRLNPEEIVPLILLLASDAGAVINGQAYNIDGGAAMF